MSNNNLLNQNSVGIQVLNSSGTYNARSLAGTANQLAIANANGTSGNPTYSLTSPIYVTGVSFNSGTNSLGIYTEGTFVPIFNTNGTAPTLTYATNGQKGRYRQMAHCISVTYYMALSANSGGTGSSVGVGSMPFTSANVNNQKFSHTMSIQNSTFPATRVNGYGVQLSNSTLSTMTLQKSAATALALTYAETSATTIVMGTGWFSTA
jgi:hypothetical protein